jgi:hypothetical protein
LAKGRSIKVGVELSDTIASHKTLTLVVGMTMVLDDFLRSVVFLNINNKRHLSVHPKEAISFGKGVSIFMSFFNFLVLIPYFSVYIYCNIVLDIVTLVVGMTMILDDFLRKAIILF